MEREKTIYLIFLVFLMLLVGSIALVPLLASEQDMGWAYAVFGPTCHQKMSRSQCLFKSQQAFWVADCTDQSGLFVTGSADREALVVERDGAVGYKFPVCARDVGIYGAMLLGAIAYPFMFGIPNRKVYPVIYLVIALIPIGIDGSLQLVSELGLLPFIYESTNLIRLLTGAIAGFVAALYSIPILVNMFSSPEDGAGADVKRD